MGRAWGIAPGLLIFLALVAVGCTAARPVQALHLEYPPGSDRRAAAEFLVGNLPKSDLLTISSGELKQNIDYAFKARDETSWGDAVPRNVFFHYVLPHRLIDEPFKSNRKWFHDQLMPLVRDCRTAWEAAVRVNLWLAARMEYRSSSAWLVAPTDLLKLGFGRCEELAVLLAAAARSVGIPVRGCWVPGWRHGDDNHVWLEVWDRGQWLPLEAVSTVADPNDNWFLKPARSAPALYSPVYGNLDKPDAPVYRRGQGFTTLNLTGRYADTGRLTVSCLDRRGVPVSGRKVYLWTLNSGVPWIVARTQTDESGDARFLLGQGSYIASSGDGHTATAGLVSTGKTAVLRLGRAMPETWTLRHPVQAHPRQRYASPVAPLDAELRKEAVRAEELRKARQEAVRQEVRVLQDGKAVIPPAVLSAFERPWASTVRLVREYLALSREDRQLLAPLVQEFHPKDLGLASLDALARLVRSRERAAGQWPVVRDSQAVFLPYVADPRVGLEPLSLDSAEVERMAAGFRRDTVRETVEAVADYFHQFDAAPKAGVPFGPPLPWSLVEKHLAQIRRGERLALCVQMLRSLGIPARRSPLREAVMYFENGEFYPVPGLSDDLRCLPKGQPQERQGEQLVRLSPKGTFSRLPWPEKDDRLCFRSGTLFRSRMDRPNPGEIRATFSPCALSGQEEAME